MAIFPKIQSPCPYKSQLASVMDGDICRMCKRQVFDLSELRDEERLVFLKGCKEEVCVSYRLPVRTAAAAAMMVAAVAAPMAAAAEDASAAVAVEVYDLVVGGINDPANAEYVQVSDDVEVPDLPVVYEGAQSTAAAPANADGTTVPVSSPAAS
jgi:hypothetical protein